MDHWKRGTGGTELRGVPLSPRPPASAWLPQSSFSLASRILRCAAKRHRAFRSDMPNSGERPGEPAAAAAPADGGQEESPDGPLPGLWAAQGRLAPSGTLPAEPLRAARFPMASIRDENAASERLMGGACTPVENPTMFSSLHKC